MNYNAIKFEFDLDDNLIGDAFGKAKNLLNFQFDDDFNVFFVESDVDYQFKDISNSTSEDIEIIKNSFFDFKFDDIRNVFLYRFLVLKNNEKITLLAIIHSSIFNYTSINNFYGLFNDLNTNPVENNLSIHYEDVKNYLDSPDFGKDSVYWRNFILNASDYVKFYNLKSNNLK